jgi:hypothetical protein
VSTTPRLSVIVPAFQGTRVLPRSLSALAASDLPKVEWELIVVDDGSTDGTSTLAARWADQVVTLPAPPRGPGYARNAGAAVAQGEWLAFVDADVLVHPDTLGQMLAAATGHDDVVAVFGAYDANPPAHGTVSQFRNLLHRYVHLMGEGEAETFWAGCGAIRRDAFMAVGGFDAERFPRPQIEDIELGYRLRDHGGRILIAPAIQGAHLKEWTFLGGTRTDVVDRGIPWVRLLLERGGLGGSGNLNLKGGERLKTGLVGAGLLLLLAAPLLGRVSGVVGLALLLVVVFLNAPVLRWFAGQRGPAFALAAAGLMLWYHFVSGVAVVLGSMAHWLHPRRTGVPAGDPSHRRAHRLTPTK